MHSLGYPHRDLKAENVLRTDRTPQAVCKITDFGLSRIAFNATSGDPRLSTSRCGTPLYAAPEVLDIFIAAAAHAPAAQRRPYCPFAADVWSAGVLFFAMINRKLPFEYKQRGAYVALREMQQSGVRTYEPWVPQEARDIIESHLALDPAERVTFAYLLGE